MRVHLRAAVRASLVVLALASSGLLLAACVPTIPNDPFQLSVRDDSVVVRWCGDETGPYEYMLLSYRLASGGDEVESLVAEGEFTLRTGDELSPGGSPVGSAVVKSSPLPLSDDRVFVFVVTGQTETSLDGPQAVFEIASLDELPEGQWVSAGGRIAVEGCGSQ